MASVLDCMLHPIDCSRAASEAAAAAAAVGVSQSVEHAGDTSIAAGAAVDRAADRIVDIENAATDPLREVSSTSMWITIGIVAVCIVILVVFGYIVIKVL